MKYVNSSIVFQEIPDEVTLAINISNCPCRCPGCHSSYLWADTGSELTTDTIDSFMREYGSDITCIAFMGGDAEPETIDMLSAYIHRTYPAIKTAWYSGRTQLSPHIDKSNLDYYKLGPYLRHLGPLNSPHHQPAPLPQDRRRGMGGHHPATAKGTAATFIGAFFFNLTLTKQKYLLKKACPDFITILRHIKIINDNQYVRRAIWVNWGDTSHVFRTIEDSL